MKRSSKKITLALALIISTALMVIPVSAADISPVLSQVSADHTGFDYPITGGIGTYIFTVAGFLILAAGVFFLFKKK